MGVQRRDWRRASRYGADEPGRTLQLERVGESEALEPLLTITANWLLLRVDDARVVQTDVDPSRGRIDWVFWVGADQVPNAEAMDGVKTASFSGGRFDVESIQFVPGAPAHWELRAVRTESLSPIEGEQ